MTTREIDGGDGGGQILRSALALAGVTGDPVRVTDVRGDRDDPGLKPQHLACVEAAAAVCDADVTGATLGSETVTFDAGDSTGGAVAVDVETAGAVTLVFETVLPFATVLDEPLSVTATGGTDVTWSPTLAYYRRVRLPLARRFGWHATVEPDRRGFYPAGGGGATLHVAPSTPSTQPPVTLTDRGELRGARIDAVATTDLADADVADRMARGAADALAAANTLSVANRPEGANTHSGANRPEEANTLAAADVPVVERTTRVVEADSTGASVCVELAYEHTVAGFDALGEPGRPAEAVGEAAATDALAFHETVAPVPVVDAFAADQLVLPLALGAGTVLPERITAHVAANCRVARAFGFDVHVADDRLVG